jgi:tripartite ATP-independent transporter DctP family solute receptor
MSNSSYKISRRDCLSSFAALAVTGSSVANAAAKGMLTSADVHPKGYPTVEAVRFIGDRLAKETGGRLNVNVYYAGQLGREPDTVELARLGAIDIARVNFAALNNAFPLTQVCSLPYVFDSVEHMRRVVDGRVGRTILDAFAKRDLVGLAIYDAGMRNFYNIQRPVSTPKDLQGLKMRVPGSDIFIEFVRALGANPTPLPVGEVYSALQTHLIDGAENNWRTFHSSRQFEVAKYWSHSQHSHSPEALLMSRKAFEALTPQDRELLVAVSKESVPYMRGLWDRMNEESREIVIQSGVQAVDVDRPAFQAAVQPVLKSYLERHDLNELYTAIRAES